MTEDQEHDIPPELKMYLSRKKLRGFGMRHCEICKVMLSVDDHQVHVCAIKTDTPWKVGKNNKPDNQAE